MGAGSSDERGEAEELTVQQQRAQFLLMQQIQEARLMNRNQNGSPAAIALNSLGLPAIPPMQQPAILMSQVLQNPAHLRGKTITLVPEKHGERMMLRFSFDARVPVVVTAYRSALLVPTVTGAWEMESAAWSSPPMPFLAGLAQSHSVEWEMPSFSQAVSMTFESDAKHCPVLVELRSEDAEMGMPGSVEWTIGQILSARNGSAEKNRVEVISQQFCSGLNQALELLEVFGSEPAADGSSRQDCIVCQSEPRDTAVLPCRHMCLCNKCSDYIRTRTQYTSYKCPICREKIGRMMRIELDECALLGCFSEEKCLDETAAATAAVAITA